MGKFRDQIEWLRQLIKNDEDDRADYQSGHRKEFEHIGSERSDVTHQRDSAAADRIRRNRKLIEMYQRHEKD